ncbi:hypothetical protein LLG88_14770 [bacterium]|nr:hypothetical protein [bacterium]
MNVLFGPSAVRVQVRAGLYLVCAIFAISLLWLPFGLIFARTTYGPNFHLVATSWTVTSVLWIVGALLLHGAARLVAASRRREARRVRVAAATLGAAALAYFAFGLRARGLGQEPAVETMLTGLGGAVLAFLAVARGGALLWWLSTAETALAAPRMSRGLYFAGAVCAGTSLLCGVVNTTYPANSAPAPTFLLAPMAWAAALGCAAALAMQLASRAPTLVRGAAAAIAAARAGDVAEARPPRKSFPARLLEFVVGFFGFQIGVALVLAGSALIGDLAFQIAVFVVVAGSIMAFVVLLRRGRTAAALGGLAALVVAPLVLMGACTVLFF